MKKYALIRDDKIVKFRTISDNDLLILSKLAAHGYLIVEEQVVPEHDYITQFLVDIYEIQKDKVLRIWTVDERPFIEAKQSKKDVVEQEVLDRIRTVFDDIEQGIKVDEILIIKDSVVVEINTAKDNIDLRAIDIDLSQVKVKRI